MPGLSEPRRLAVPSLAAALVAVPLLSLGQVFERGLRVEAAAILTVLGLGWFLGDRRQPGGHGAEPRTLLWILGLWTVAAGWGGAVGLLSGNPIRNVLSQTLAMLLFPLGAAVFVRLRGLTADRFALGCLIGLAGAIAVRGLAQASWSVAGFWGGRLRIGAASLADAGSILAILGVGMMLAGRWRWLGLLASALGAAVVLAGHSRGQWLATGLAFGATTIFFVPARKRGLVLRGAAGSLVAAALAVAWICRGGVEPLAIAAASMARPVEAIAGAGGARIASLKAPEVAAIRVAGSMRAGRGDRCTVWAVGSGVEGAMIARSWATVVGSGAVGPFSAVFDRPGAVTHLRIGLTARRGRCSLENARIDAIERPSAAWLRGLIGLPVTRDTGLGHGRRPVAKLARRLQQLTTAVRAPWGDVTVAYRLAEQRALMAAWQAAPLWRKGLGHGLGATIAFPNPSWDAEGRPIVAERTSYLHNVYAALLFKLGWAGVVACGAIGALAIWLLIALRGRPAWPIAAVAACLGAYLLWSVVSPQLLNFRMAPLLGALVALAMRLAPSSDCARIP